MIRTTIKKKRVLITLSSVIVLVMIMLFSPLNFGQLNKEHPAEEKLSDQAIELLDQKENDKGIAAYADSINANSQVWTLYAQLLMGDANVEEAAEGTGQVKLLGQGGVSADFPFSDITKDGNDLTGSNAGTQLASFLATYNYYGYIETVAGNTIATNVSSFFGGAARLVGSIIGGISLTLQGVAEKFNQMIANFILSLDMWSILGFGDPVEGNTNPITKVVTSFFEALGLTNGLLKALIELMLIIVLGGFLFAIMRGLATEGFKSSRAKRAAKRIILTFVLFFVYFPMSHALVSAIIQDIKAESDEGSLAGNTVSAYIINTKLWAISQNLAPDSTLGGGQVPSANDKSPIKWVDADYEPSNKRDMISLINTQSYATQNTSLDSSVMGMALIKEWSTNDTFNINDYAGGINVAKDDSYMQNIPALAANSSYPGDSEKNVVLARPNKLPNYIWSADQNIEDSNRNPSGEGVVEDSKDNGKIKFDASSQWGVQDNRTFSTQSVALLLQSELSSNGTKLYMYNLPPSGVQGMAKNMSTVKTTWRTAALVGHGALGKFGSFLAMVSESLVIAVLFFCCAWAMFTINIIEAAVTFVKRVFQTVAFSSEAAAAGGIAISIGIIFTGAVGLGLPKTLIQVTRDISEATLSLISSDLMMDGIGNLMHGLLVLFFGYLLALKKTKDGVSIVQMMVSLPLTIAMEIDKRAKIMLGYNSGLQRAAAGMPGIDGYSGSNHMNMGAKNPYYDENYGRDSEGGEGKSHSGLNSGKDILTKGLEIAGAKTLADKLNSIGDGDAEQITKRANDLLNRNSVSDNDRDQNKKSSRQLMEEHNKRMEEISQDPMGRLVNSEGNFVDTEGNEINDSNYGMTADGSFVDNAGRLVDEEGNLIDEQGNQLDNEAGIGRSVKGNLLDEEGRLVDENGNLIDRNGEIIEDEGYGINEDGQRIDDAGRLVNEAGELIDENGEIIDEELGYGQDANGNLVDSKHRLVDEEGNFIDLDGNAIEDGYGMDAEGNLRDNQGRKIDEDGNLLAPVELQGDEIDLQDRGDFEGDTIREDEQDLNEIQNQSADLSGEVIEDEQGSVTNTIEQSDSSYSSGITIDKGKVIEPTEEPAENGEEDRTTRREIREQKEGVRREAKAEVRKEVSTEALKKMAQTTKNVGAAGGRKIATEFHKAPAGSIAGVTRTAVSKTANVLKKGNQAAKKSKQLEVENPFLRYKQKVNEKIDEKNLDE